MATTLNNVLDHPIVLLVILAIGAVIGIAVEKEALRRANIGYVEVVSGDKPAEVREMLRKLMGRVQT